MPELRRTRISRASETKRFRFVQKLERPTEWGLAGLFSGRSKASGKREIRKVATTGGPRRYDFGEDSLGDRKRRVRIRRARTDVFERMGGQAKAAGKLEESLALEAQT